MSADEPAEFRELLDASMETLDTITAAHHETWGIGAADRWDFNQDRGCLVFTFPRRIATAPAQIIGTFNSQAGTWMWAWNNKTIAPALTRDSLRVKEYGLKHKIARLTTPTWDGGETDGWEMTALACRLCEAQGAYRGPAGATFVFFTFGDVSINPSA